MALGIFTHPTGAFAQLDPNDPWPKFARDEGNTCYTTVRGPHAPDLRWHGELQSNRQLNQRHHGGAAIGRFSGRNYAIVGTPGPGEYPRLYVFDVEATPADPLVPLTATAVIQLPLSTDGVDSTPLILPDRTVVVQTRTWLIAYDFSSFPSATPTVVWTSPALNSGGASPALGWTTRNVQQRAMRIYALGGEKIVSLDPAVGTSFEMDFVLRSGISAGNALTCPAVGPLDPNDPSYVFIDSNLVYCSTFGSELDGLDHVYSLYADNVPRGSPATIQVWGTRADVYDGFITGSFASPSVYREGWDLAGRIVVGTDDGGLYGLWNRTDVNGDFVRRWHRSGGTHVSSTAALTPTNDILYLEEGPAAFQCVDQETTATEPQQTALHTGARPYSSAGAADPHRFYCGTLRWIVGPQPDNDEARVLGLCYVGGSAARAPIRTWKFTPPQIQEDPRPEPASTHLQRGFNAPIAVNTDGTIIAVNDGYIFALRPLRADFNGDGCRNNFDVDAFALAITDPDTWEQDYGAPYGINRVSIGDCNDDGVVNNFDLDCFVDIVVADPRCVPEFLGPCPSGESSGSESGARGESGEPAADSDWAYFYEVVAYLRALFDMN
ncbi:MAG: hypothetical protein AB7Q17_05440 [Phycisphaerae bacterium]